MKKNPVLSQERYETRTLPLTHLHPKAEPYVMTMYIINNYNCQLIRLIL